MGSVDEELRGFGGDESGGDADGADAEGSAFDGELLGEVDHAAFRRAVHVLGEEFDAADAGDRADVDDDAAALLEVLPGVVDGVVDEVQFEIDVALPVGDGEFVDGAERGLPAGVVVEDVDAAVGGCGILDPGLDLRGVAGIHRSEPGDLPARFTDETDGLLQGGGVQITPDDLRALGGELLRGLAAHPCPDPGDQGDLALKPTHGVLLLRRAHRGVNRTWWPARARTRSSRATRARRRL